MREGIISAKNSENIESDSCSYIQQRMRGILARKHVERMRNEEMFFLGMA